jgi:hypothetical protein
MTVPLLMKHVTPALAEKEDVKMRVQQQQQQHQLPPLQQQQQLPPLQQQQQQHQLPPLQQHHHQVNLVYMYAKYVTKVFTNVWLLFKKNPNVFLQASTWFLAFK